MKQIFIINNLMLILRGDPTDSYIKGGTKDSEISLEENYRVQIYYDEKDKTKLKEVSVGKEIINNTQRDIKATGFYISTPSLGTNGAKAFIRTINCVFIITRFMIIFMEKDPGKDAILELINPTFGFLNDKMLKDDNKYKNTEIKLSFRNEDEEDFDPANLENELLLNNKSSKITKQINKYLKVHDSVKGKRNYIIDFSFPTKSTNAFHFSIEPVLKDKLEESALSMNFEKLVDIFSKSLLEDDDFELSGSAGELALLKKKNANLLKAIQKSKEYLENANKNLTKYSKNMPIIK
jgi:hypothetical protein